MHNHISVYPTVLQGFSFKTVIIPLVRYLRGELYLCLDNNTCSNSRWWVYANDAKMNHEMFASIFNSLSELIFWQVVKWFQREKRLKGCSKRLFKSVEPVLWSKDQFDRFQMANSGPRVTLLFILSSRKSLPLPHLVDFKT